MFEPVRGVVGKMMRVTVGEDPTVSNVHVEMRLSDDGTRRIISTFLLPTYPRHTPLTYPIYYVGLQPLLAAPQ